MSIIGKLLGWIGLPQWLLELAVVGLALTGYGLWHHKVYEEGIAAKGAEVAHQDAAQIKAAQDRATTAEHSHDQELSDLRTYRATHSDVDVSLCEQPQPDAGVQVAGTRPVDARGGAGAGVVQPVPTGDNPVRQVTTGRPIGGMLDALASRADEVSAQLRVYQRVTP